MKWAVFRFGMIAGLAVGATPRLAAPQPLVPVTPPSEFGIAAWYGEEFHGKQTASGELFNMNDLTAAHRTLPLGMRVRVTNLRNGQSVVVRINDRGPWNSSKRIIDLSKAASGRLDLIRSGWGPVRLDPLGRT